MSAGFWEIQNNSVWGEEKEQGGVSEAGQGLLYTVAQSGG